MSSNPLQEFHLDNPTYAYLILELEFRRAIYNQFDNSEIKELID